MFDRIRAQGTRLMAVGRPPEGIFQGWTMRGLKDGSPPAESSGSSSVGIWGQSPQKLTTFSQYGK